MKFNLLLDIPRVIVFSFQKAVTPIITYTESSNKCLARENYCQQRTKSMDINIYNYSQSTYRFRDC